MKKAVRSRSILDDIPRLVFDQSAVTPAEIADHAGMKITWAKQLAAERVKAGLWEQVWKRTNARQPVMAYRRK